MLRSLALKEITCPKDLIVCDYSDDKDCRQTRDTSPECGWYKTCCTQNCKPNKEKNGRVCVRATKAPPKDSSEDYGYGFVAYDDEEGAFVTSFADILGSEDAEDYVSDEDEEEFDSEDLASEDSADNDEDETDTEDIDLNNKYVSDCVPIYSRSGRTNYNYLGPSGNKNLYGDLDSCCRQEFNDCKDNDYFYYYRANENCARNRGKCDGTRSNLEVEVA